MRLAALILIGATLLASAARGIAASHAQPGAAVRATRAAATPASSELAVAPTTSALAAAAPATSAFAAATPAARSATSAFAAAVPAARSAKSAAPAVSDSLRWPDGTVLLQIENLEGLLLLPASMRSASGRDTSGLLALDSGAGYLALDRELALWAGIAAASNDTAAIGLADRALPRLSLGSLDLDQLSPVMTVNGGIVRAVTDRAVLGLLGQRPLADRIVWIDAERGQVALIPARAPSDAASRDQTIPASRASLAGLLSTRATAIQFRLRGDGKIVFTARVAERGAHVRSAPLTLVLDTGATKTVLFQPMRGNLEQRAERWRMMKGLSVPTLLGPSSATMVMIPGLSLGSAGSAVIVHDVDAALLSSQLSDQLTNAVGEPVDGLLGGSCLWRFRVAIDYPRRVVWLDPIANWRSPRPFEYSHVGLQLERRDGALRIVGLVEASPAERAGVVIGDDVVEIDGKAAGDMDLIAANEALEGPPGSAVTIAVSHAGKITRLKLIRRTLL